MKPIVLCMKWGTLYGAEYVNVLARAARFYLKRDHQFVCMTDDPTGLIDLVEVMALPDMNLDPSFWRHGGWPKLGVFEKGRFEDGQPVLFIDLDTVICANFDALFDEISGVTMIREWKRFVDYLNPFRPQKAMSSIFGFIAGQQDHIWERFKHDPQAARRRFRIEQYFLAHHADGLNYWSEPSIISFKRHLLPPAFGVREGARVKPPPPNAKLIAFHGEPRPIDVARESGAIWGKRFRYGRGSVPYIKAYWDQFST